MLTLIAQWFNLICTIALIVVFVKLIRLLVRALKKYLGEGNPQATQEAAAIRMTLSQRLKALRTERGFTQELVAASLGVSRQAVSKWENGHFRTKHFQSVSIIKTLRYFRHRIVTEY